MSTEQVIVSTSCPACNGVPTAIPTATASGKLKLSKPFSGRSPGQPNNVLYHELHWSYPKTQWYWGRTWPSLISWASFYNWAYPCLCFTLWYKPVSPWCCSGHSGNLTSGSGGLLWVLLPCARPRVHVPALKYLWLRCTERPTSLQEDKPLLQKSWGNICSMVRFCHQALLSVSAAVGDAVQLLLLLARNK